jgi:enediyne biosynthesis protein E4
MKFFYLLILSLFVSGCTGNRQPDSGKNEQLFTLLSAESTNIDFINEVVDTEKFNVLTYRNFYNGGGVAIGDINNDGLPDIYFSANQKKNKLYVNKGNFVFEDITKSAGVEGNKFWSTGVTMVDINADGLLDVYVCNAGDIDGSNRENELFINNGNLTFSEQAKAYNLNNNGYSTHAAFFDYDSDGDLDCYILNNSFKDPGKIELYKDVRSIAHPEGDKLMRNDSGIFHDVTAEAGIYSSNIGFGLGVSVSDLNNDHLPDIYISNDFWERDYLYLNKGNGTFSEELTARMNYCPVSSMGADIADLNNDGAPEIFTTDMLPGDNYHLKTAVGFDPYHLEDLKYRANFHYQMIQNCLQLNDGNANFQEVALLAGVSATDWSWGALLFDFENDGNKDIFVSNGIAKDVMSLDFRDFLAEAEHKAKQGSVDYLALTSKMPSRPLSNFAFKSSGKLQFTNQAEQLGLSQRSFSNGSAYGDLDNDGDMDLVVNNVNSTSFVYRNETNTIYKKHYLKVKLRGPANNIFGIGAKVSIKTKDVEQVLENYNARGFQSSIEPHLLFGLDSAETVNELIVIWPDQKTQRLTSIKSNQTLLLDYKNAMLLKPEIKSQVKPLFEETSNTRIPGGAMHNENPYNDFNFEILLMNMLSTEGPRLVVGDANGDHLEDFILLGAKGDPDKLFLQKKDNSFQHRAMAAFVTDRRFESTCGALFDYDDDNDLDLMIGSGGNELENSLDFIVRLYINDGKGNFRADPNNIPQCIGNFSTLEAKDFDADGDVDIFLGARAVPGNYGLPPKSYLFKNENGMWYDVAKPSLANVGMVTDATWLDIDADKDLDLVVVGDWMPINIFINEYGLLNDPIIVKNSNGWWTRVEAADLDHDNHIDLVLGNWGLNSKLKASVDRPITMFVDDFDDNGKSEFIINWYPPFDQVAYPFAPKTELTFQLPGLRKSILRYEDYAGKTYDSLFAPHTRQSALKYRVNFLESAVLWNNGNMKFQLTPLPMEAQVSPVFGIITDDLDEDGYEDIWLGGNFYGMKPQLGRHDASRGIFLKGLEARLFDNVSSNASGIFVGGQVRDATVLRAMSSTQILIARNNGSVLLFEKKP